MHKTVKTYHPFTVTVLLATTCQNAGLSRGCCDWAKSDCRTSGDCYCDEWCRQHNDCCPDVPIRTMCRSDGKKTILMCYIH